MSKRHLELQNLDRKRVKLDSGAASSSRQDNWGDDNEDEILLLATQACEQQVVSQPNVSMLPDYDCWNKPDATSTQQYDTRNTFVFKKPNVGKQHQSCSNKWINIPETKSTCIVNNENIQNDIYSMITELKEENAKMKLENGKLLEKCLMCEGEVSILRSQLKGSQVAIERARLEQLKTEQAMNMEWNDKINISNKDVHNLKTQLEFKELEVINLKEKCRMLESNKIKLSQKPNTSEFSCSRNVTSRAGRTRNDTRHAESQTVTQHRLFPIVTVAYETNSITDDHIATLIELLNMNPNKLAVRYRHLKHQRTSQPRYRVFNTCHSLNKVARNIALRRDRRLETLGCHGATTLDGLHDCVRFHSINEQFLNGYNKLVSTLCNCLKEIIDNMTCTDDQLHYTTLNYSLNAMISNRALTTNETHIDIRRMLSMVTLFCNSFVRLQCENIHRPLTEVVQKYCERIASVGCSNELAMVTLSLVKYLKTSHKHINKVILVKMLICLVLSDPLTYVLNCICDIMTHREDIGLTDVCHDGGYNVKVDREQGCLYYKRTTCPLQVMFKQYELCFNGMHDLENSDTIDNVKFLMCLDITDRLFTLYYKFCTDIWSNLNSRRCECHNMLVQVIVLSVNKYTRLLYNGTMSTDRVSKETQMLYVRARAACERCVNMVHNMMQHDVDVGVQLMSYEGYYQNLIWTLYENKDVLRLHQIHSNMLTELYTNIQMYNEDCDTPAESSSEVNSVLNNLWIDSFEMFHIYD